MKRRLASWFHTVMMYLMGPWGYALWQRRRDDRKLRKRGEDRG